MKKIALVCILAMFAFAPGRAGAQVTVNINISTQPDWGPAGYEHVDYYYIPDIDVYYYVPSAQYVYLSDGRWIWRSSLPDKYRGYDLYKAYKVVMNTPKPYANHSAHVTKYKAYKGKGSSQQLLRDNRGTSSGRSSSGSASSGRSSSGSRASSADKRPSGNSEKGSGAGRGNDRKDSREQRGR